MTQPPSLRSLLSGIARVADTLAGIVILGVALDHLFALPLPGWGSWRLWGLVPLSLGVWLEASATHAFWTHGHGTPNPESHPARLVVEGPYSWSRHPLYLARHLMLFGSACILASPATAVLTLLLYLVVEFVLIPREEARLAGRFAAEYEAYRRRVSKWVTIRRHQVVSSSGRIPPETSDPPKTHFIGHRKRRS